MRTHALLFVDHAEADARIAALEIVEHLA
jgi:hypothetical protein